MDRRGFFQALIGGLVAGGAAIAVDRALRAPVPACAEEVEKSIEARVVLIPPGFTGPIEPYVWSRELKNYIPARATQHVHYRKRRWVNEYRNIPIYEYDD